MTAKIQLKSDSTGIFGGIFLVFSMFDRVGMSQLINNLLGPRRFNAKYSYADVIMTLMATYLCGGTCIEDVQLFLGQLHQKLKKYKCCSPDVIFNVLKELSVESEIHQSASGIEYQFNHTPALTRLALESLVLCGQIDPQEPVTFDYDNQVVSNEKRDAKYTYKQCFGDFPGIAQINGMPFFMENRDGNANVKFRQAETLAKAYAALEEMGIKVGQARMDCGSYAKEIIEMVAAHSERFYIRAAQCQALRERITEIADDAWEDAEINYNKCQLASIPFTSFFAERGYRLVVQRTLNEDRQLSLFEGRYTYRCILTNDHEMSNVDVVIFYNQRGSTERCFDCMNNDFGWSHLPSSDMKANTVFMSLMIVIHNFYRYLTSQLESKGFGLTKTSRVKKTILRFMAVPYKWVTSGKNLVLQLHTRNQAYLQLQL